MTVQSSFHQRTDARVNLGVSLARSEKSVHDVEPQSTVRTADNSEYKVDKYGGRKAAVTPKRARLQGNKEFWWGPSKGP